MRCVLRLRRHGRAADTPGRGSRFHTFGSMGSAPFTFRTRRTAVSAPQRSDSSGRPEPRRRREERAGFAYSPCVAPWPMKPMSKPDITRYIFTRYTKNGRIVGAGSSILWRVHVIMMCMRGLDTVSGSKGGGGEVLPKVAVAESAMGGFRRKRKLRLFHFFIKLFLQEILISYKIFKKNVLSPRLSYACACARVCRGGGALGPPRSAAERFGVPEPPSPSVFFQLFTSSPSFWSPIVCRLCFRTRCTRRACRPPPPVFALSLICSPWSSAAVTI